MYCNWKLLIIFGSIFWILLYLSDMYLLDPHPKFITEEDRIIFYIDDTQKQPILEPPLTEDSTLFIILWSFTTFVVTIATCFLIKYLNTRILNQMIGTNFYGPNLLKRSKSRIPISINNKTFNDVEIETDSLASKSCVKLEESYTNTTNVTTQNRSTNTTELLKTSNCLERDKIFKTASQMEKHYAKLRDDLLNQQITFKKEQEQMQKRIDSLCKEKRDLSNKIANLNKENKIAKQQMEELLNEKNSMSKRLENANKEIKNNIKTKKVTLEKLEESLITIDKLNKRLEQMSRDKEIIDNKFGLLETEYKELQDKFKLDENLIETNEILFVNENNDYLNEKPEKDLTASGDNFPNIHESVQSLDDNETNLSQSEIDIQKVQLKLLNLEKSLDKLTLKETNVELKQSMTNIWDELKLTDNETDVNQSLDLTSRSNESICTDINCPLEHQSCTDGNCLIKEDEEDDATTFDLNILEDNDLLEALRNDFKYVVNIEELKNKILSQSSIEVNECVDSILEIEKEINKNLLNIRKEYDENDNNSDETEDAKDDVNETLSDENLRQWELRKGIVSNSPEFQKFLMKILETDL